MRKRRKVEVELPENKVVWGEELAVENASKVEFLFGAGGKVEEVNLRQTKIAPLTEAELIALGIAREIIMKVIMEQLEAKLKVTVDREVMEVMAVMELQEEWVDRDTEKELDAMVEILKELDIESDKKAKIT